MILFTLSSSSVSLFSAIPTVITLCKRVSTSGSFSQMAAHSSILQHLPHQTRHPSNVDAFQSSIYFFTNHMTADVAYYTCLYITAYNDDHIYLISGHLPTDVCMYFL